MTEISRSPPVLTAPRPMGDAVRRHRCFGLIARDRVVRHSMRLLFLFICGSISHNGPGGNLWTIDLI